MTKKNNYSTVIYVGYVEIFTPGGYNITIKICCAWVTLKKTSDLFFF